MDNRNPVKNTNKEEFDNSFHSLNRLGFEWVSGEPMFSVKDDSIVNDGLVF